MRKHPEWIISCATAQFNLSCCRSSPGAEMGVFPPAASAEHIRRYPAHWGLSGSVFTNCWNTTGGYNCTISVSGYTRQHYSSLTAKYCRIVKKEQQQMLCCDVIHTWFSFRMARALALNDSSGLRLHCHTNITKRLQAESRSNCVYLFVRGLYISRKCVILISSAVHVLFVTIQILVCDQMPK